MAFLSLIFHKLQSVLNHLQNYLFTVFCHGNSIDISEKQFDTPESDKKSDHEDEASLDKDGVENYDSNSSSEDELEDLVERVKIRKEGLNMKINELIERVSFWEKRIET